LKDVSILVSCFKHLQNLTKQFKSNSSEMVLEAEAELILFEAAQTSDFSSIDDELSHLFKLSPLVDDMLENVFINTENESLRLSRLSLISEVKAQFLRIADFSKIS